MNTHIPGWLAMGLVVALAGIGPPTARGSGAAPAEFESAPHQFIADISRSLVVLIDEGRGYAHEDPERFFAAVESLLSPAIDFRGFARRVMAVHYRRASPQQRSRFAETFKWSLIRTYALSLTEFVGGEMVVLPPAGPPRHPTRRNVKMEIRSGGEVYPVIYTTVLQDGHWRIGNIIMAGVNIGLTYRGQFASMAADNRYQADLDQLIDAWADFVAAGPQAGKEEA